MPNDFLFQPEMSQAFSPEEQGLLDYHRMNLGGDGYLLDDQGLTTINMMGVTGPDGRIYNVPGYWSGARRSPEEARANAESMGWENFPSYETGEESNKAAKALHGIIDSDAKKWFAENPLKRLPQ